MHCIRLTIRQQWLLRVGCVVRVRCTYLDFLLNVCVWILWICAKMVICENVRNSHAKCKSKIERLLVLVSKTQRNVPVIISVWSKWITGLSLFTSYCALFFSVCSCRCSLLIFVFADNFEHTLCDHFCVVACENPTFKREVLFWMAYVDPYKSFCA